MLNVFEQPWALLGAAVLVLFGLLTYRSVCPEKRRWWQWLIPLAVAAVGLGLDFLVVTDLEKVRGTIASLLKAVEKEDCAAVADLIAPDYSDSRHETKAQLMARCRQELDGQSVQTLKQRGAEIDLSDWNVTVMLNLFIRFEPESRIARQYKAVALARVRLYLGKRPDGNWLIDRAELLEVDQFPVSWRDL